MAQKSDRVNFALPVVPQSLKAFIEKAVNNQRFMLAFVESPLSALHGAGVPVRADRLTQTDFDRFILVLGRLRNLVANGTIPKNFQYEAVFTIGADVEYEQTNTSSDSYCTQNFDHSVDGSTCEQTSSTETGIQTNFSGGVSEQVGDDIIAPLLSPGNLAAIATLMEAQIDSQFGE